MRSKSYFLLFVLLLSYGSMSMVLSMNNDDLVHEDLVPKQIHIESSSSDQIHGLSKKKMLKLPSGIHYDKIYQQAIEQYEGDVNTAAVQIVDEYGNFLTVPRKPVDNLELPEKEVEELRAGETLQSLVGAIKDLDSQKYLVVSIFGHQSTGKSYLLNKLFGTDFSIKEGHNKQQTRGIWLARSSQVENLVVVDCEGTGGVEKLEQTGIQTKMAELGMLYTMLVSQIVIFNLDVGHLTSEQHAAMFINTLNNYMNFRVKDSPPLRVIISVRNVGTNIKPSKHQEDAFKIVERAYNENEHSKDAPLKAFFDVHFFWFGHYSDDPIEFPAKNFGYKDEEFTEDNVLPYFHQRLAYFKDRFTNPMNKHYYLEGLVPLEAARKLPAFLHQFWDLASNVEGGALGNPLELLVESRLVEAAKKLIHEYEKGFVEMIQINKVNTPEVANEALVHYTKGALKHLPAELEELVPFYGRKYAARHIEEFIRSLNKINDEMSVELMEALALESVKLLKEQAEDLLQNNKREQELEALGLFEKYLTDIQKLNPKAKPNTWNTPLKNAKHQLQEEIKKKVEERILSAIMDGLDHIKAHPSQYIENIASLADNIAQEEAIDDERDIKQIENDIAKHISGGLDLQSRKTSVLSILDDNYSPGIHLAAATTDHSHLDEAVGKAHERRESLLAFRNHFHGRIPFKHDAESWDEQMKDAIKDEATRKRHARDNRKAELESSHRESSLRYALAGLMTYVVVVERTFLTLVVMTVIFFLAVTGLLGPQILDFHRWATLGNTLSLLSGGSYKTAAMLFLSKGKKD